MHGRGLHLALAGGHAGGRQRRVASPDRVSTSFRPDAEEGLREASGGQVGGLVAGDGDQGGLRPISGDITLPSIRMLGNCCISARTVGSMILGLGIGGPLYLTGST